MHGNLDILPSLLQKLYGYHNPFIKTMPQANCNITTWLQNIGTNQLQLKRDKQATHNKICTHKNQILHVLACVITEWIYSCWISVNRYYKVMNRTLYVSIYLSHSYVLTHCCGIHDMASPPF